MPSRLADLLARTALAYVSYVFFSPLALGSDKTFFAISQVCSIAGGQVYISNEAETYYMEIIGPTNGVPTQFCGKGWFSIRQCRPLTLYNFQLVCRNGTAGAPGLYMALFGRDKETVEQGFNLNGDQLSYIDPGTNLYQTNPSRVNFPRGYAPFPSAQMPTLLKTLSWDDNNQRPTIARNLGRDQETRIQSLFAVRNGYIEPFPESNIQRAIAISVEPPVVPPVAPPPPKLSESPKSTPTRPADPSTVYFLVAFAVALFIWAIKKQVPIKSIQGAVIVATVASILSSAILYWLGLKDGITLLSTTVFWTLVFSITLFS